MELVAAISRGNAGRNLGEVLDIKSLATPIFATAPEALATEPDVFVEFTKPNVAKFNILSALRNRAHVVVGTSGLSEDDYQEIGEVAREVRRGVLAAGNFALTVVLQRDGTLNRKPTEIFASLNVAICIASAIISALTRPRTFP
jgi:4-hydroxy-tetrahydrodipicolinate reductase